MALRKPPGQRTQIFRMTQAGGLLNAPVNTPAPGTGAIDARVSPDGRLVAYWFVTTVPTGECAFCVSAAEQTLFSYADRFTRYDELGRPMLGGWPSWIGNDTVLVNTGSPTQRYFRFGMPEAQGWFADSDVVPQGLQTLLDSEVARTGDRLAVVRGDHQEQIVLLNMHGAPPAKPTLPPTGGQGFAQPSGAFHDPTWSTDGRTLAWQEDDGIWVGQVPADLTTCAGLPAPALRIAGGRAPDFGPAPINPGARPACESPGNPAPCPHDVGPTPNPTPGPGPGPSPQPTLASRLGTLAAGQAGALARLRIGGLLRKRAFGVAFAAPGAGTLTVRLTAGRTLLAGGRHVYRSASRATVKARLARAGAKRLRRARSLKARLRLTFSPRGGAKVSAVRTVALRR